MADEEDIPIALMPRAREIVRHFEALDGRRQIGMTGPQPIAWLDLMGYCQFLGVRLSVWDVRQILTLDDIYRGVYYELRPAKQS